MKRSYLSAAALTLIFSSAAAYSQYSGPTQGKTIVTIAEAQKADDKAQVNLEGFITAKIRDEHYTFTNATGSMEVEIDNKDFLTNVQVNEKTRVRLRGEVDKSFGEKTKIDVKRMELF